MTHVEINTVSDFNNSGSTKNFTTNFAGSTKVQNLVGNSSIINVCSVPVEKELYKLEFPPLWKHGATIHDELHHKKNLKYLTVIDYLNIHLKFTRAAFKYIRNYSGRNFRFQKTKRSRNCSSMRESYVVYYKQNLIGIVSVNPITTEYYDRGSILLEFDNSLFYNNKWSEYLNVLLEELPFTFFEVNEFHIALDSIRNEKIFQCCNDYIFKKTIQFGNEHIKIHTQEFSKPDRRFNGFILGSRTSKKYFRIYNKSKEILVSGKNYIEEFWKANHLDTSKDVYRLELVVKKQLLKKYDIQCTTDLTRMDFISGILKKEFISSVKFYKCKLKDVNSGIRKEYLLKKSKQINVVLWNQINTSEINYLATAIPVSKVNNAKRSITFAYNEVAWNVTGTSFQTAINFINDTAYKYDLRGWCDRKFNNSNRGTPFNGLYRNEEEIVKNDIKNQ